MHSLGPLTSQVILILASKFFTFIKFFTFMHTVSKLRYYKSYSQINCIFSFFGLQIHMDQFISNHHTSHHITPHHVTSHHNDIASHHVTSRYVTSHNNNNNNIASLGRQDLVTQFLVKMTFLYKHVAKKLDFVLSKLQISI